MLVSLADILLRRLQLQQRFFTLQLLLLDELRDEPLATLGPATPWQRAYSRRTCSCCLMIFAFIRILDFSERFSFCIRSMISLP
jgi:hypothetical protein